MYSERKSFSLFRSLLIFLYFAILVFLFHPKQYVPVIIDYWPAWFSNADRIDLLNTPDFVDVINIASALPNGKGDLLWKDEVDSEKTKQVIQLLQEKKKRVLISIGGSTAEHWNLKKINITQFANNIKKFVDFYHLNGVDINYELIENRDSLILLIQELRNLMPKGQYLITFAASGIGAYGIKNHEHPEWNPFPFKGSDIETLTATRDIIDWVNVMAYNVFAPNVIPPYDPREALLAFKSLMNGRADKVVLGINIGKHDWPPNTITNSHSMKTWLSFVKNQRFKGVMLWTLKMDNEQETLETTGTFSNILRHHASW